MVDFIGNVGDEKCQVVETIGDGKYVCIRNMKLYKSVSGMILPIPTPALLYFTYPRLV